METIKLLILDEERALYHTQNKIIESVRFDGQKDGESALKECRNIIVNNCYFNLRYPLWHGSKVVITSSEFTLQCRAPLWYSNNIEINNSIIDGTKALRECKDITIGDCKIDSSEFGWKCQNISLKGSTINSEYAFFESKDINCSNLEFSGKYSFQYSKNIQIDNSNLHTKDAFWHGENIAVKDSYLKGEYLAWYSKNLTLINCIIEGTQPFCYCENIKLINCQLIGCDYSFENSSVEAEIIGHVDSIKNPLKGKIIVDSVGEIINDDEIYNCCGEVIVRKTIF